MKRLTFYLLSISVLILAACGNNEDVSTEEATATEGEDRTELAELEDENEELRRQLEEQDDEAENMEEETGDVESADQTSAESLSREEYEEENAPSMADMPTEDRDFTTATEDVLEFIEYNDTDILVDGPHDYLILERYEFPEVHDSGRNRIDFNGFKQEFGLFLVEDEFGYKHIFYGGEHINDTEEVIDYNGTMTYVTDTGEQFSPEYGLPGAMYNDLIMSYEPGVKKVDFTLAELENQEEIPDEVRVMFGGLYRITDSGVDIENMWTEDTEVTFYKQ